MLIHIILSKVGLFTMVYLIMFKIFNFTKRPRGFSLLELLVVMAIVAIGSSAVFPLYTKSVKRTNVSKIVNKMGSFKLGLIDSYTATGAWPTTLNNTAILATSPDTFFAYAQNFHYNNNANKTWFGYQLSDDYGSGWIFMLIIANSDKDFEIHCGSLEAACGWGSCNSQDYYPAACSETDLSDTYHL